MINIQLHPVSDNEIIVRVLKNEKLVILGTLVGVDQDTIEERIITALEQAFIMEDADA